MNKIICTCMYILTVLGLFLRAFSFTLGLLRNLQPQDGPLGVSVSVDLVEKEDTPVI